MRYLIVFVILMNVVVSKAQKRWFHYKFDHVKQYCGGAAPTESNLWSDREKSFFGNKMIYFYINDKCIDSVRTDSIGRISIKLKPGKYNLYLPYKHFKGVPYGTEKEYDMVCMQKEWARPDATLKMKFLGGHIFMNRAIGYEVCPWKYNCLKERHIPPSSPKQN